MIPPYIFWAILRKLSWKVTKKHFKSNISSKNIKNILSQLACFFLLVSIMHAKRDVAFKKTFIFSLIFLICFSCTFKINFIQNIIDLMLQYLIYIISRILIISNSIYKFNFKKPLNFVIKLPKLVINGLSSTFFNMTAKKSMLACWVHPKN